MGKRRAASVLFKPEEFRDTKYDDAATKAAFANQFAAFVEKGFPNHLFTRTFYERLMSMFGHIAHYNQGGFWDHWFDTLADRKRFVEVCLLWTPCGDPQHCYSDVEGALQRWMRRERVLETLTEQLNASVEAAERAQLAMLRLKYPDR